MNKLITVNRFLIAALLWLFEHQKVETSWHNIKKALIYINRNYYLDTF